jgi:hypothetical protein
VLPLRHQAVAGWTIAKLRLSVAQRAVQASVVASDD